VVAWLFVGTTLLCLGALAAGAATGNLNATDLPVISGTVETAGSLIFLATGIPVVFLAARWIWRRHAGTVSSVIGRLRWSWLGTCLLVAVPTTALMVGVNVAMTAIADKPVADAGSWVGWAPFATAMAMIVLLVPFQAAAEEYLFRGWLMQAVGAFCRSPLVPITVQALLFGAAHGWVGGLGGLLLYVVFGAVFGVITVRTGGLEAAIALHITNNVFALGMAAAAGALGKDIASLPLPEAAVLSLIIVAYGVVVLKLASRREIDSVVPETPPTAMQHVPAQATV
jgi:membrane protease YdiL (CAAX protease family)